MAFNSKTPLENNSAFLFEIWRSCYVVHLAQNLLTQKLREYDLRAGQYSVQHSVFFSRICSMFLHWLSNRTIRILSKIGLNNLIFEGDGCGRALDAELRCIYEVDCAFVEPYSSTVLSCKRISISSVHFG